MPKRTNTKCDRRIKRKYAKPVSLYGVTFEQAVEGLLQTEPPKKRKGKQKKK